MIQMQYWLWGANWNVPVDVGRNKLNIYEKMLNKSEWRVYMKICHKRQNKWYSITDVT